MEPMRGRYPGGPSRRDPGDSETSRRGNVRLTSVEEFESHLLRGSQRHRARKRQKRLALGILLWLMVAVAVGGYIGFSTHRTDAELAGEMDQQNRLSKGELEQQMNRLIDEMWKSEALEKAPNIR